MLGDCLGGAVRLAPVNTTLAIGEGIETCLSVLQATGIPTWAALSAGGIAKLILPELPLACELILLADHDRAGIEAVERAAQRWSAEGRLVRIALPEWPGEDFNDTLRRIPQRDC